MDKVRVVEFEIKRKINGYFRTGNRNAGGGNVHRNPRGTCTFTHNVDIPLTFDHWLVESELEIARQRNIGRTVQRAYAQDAQRHQLAGFQLLNNLPTKFPAQVLLRTISFAERSCHTFFPSTPS